MELSLANGWTQVEPKETQFELLVPDQPDGQRLVACDTGFNRQRELGSSGGLNCPVAVDETGNRVFQSADGIVAYDLGRVEQSECKINHDLSPIWMLECVSTGPELLMHLLGDDPNQCFVARLDIENGSTRKELLPQGTFIPLDVNRTQDRVLYSTLKGAAVYDVKRALRTVTSVDLPVQVLGGVFDANEQRVVLAGQGLWGWNLRTGEIIRLCEHGSCPAIDGAGGMWFSLNGGTLAKLGAEAGSFDVIVELSGLNTSDVTGGNYAQPVIFSPDARYGLATLTGSTELKGKELAEAEAFCKQVGQPFSEFHKHHYHHYLCVLDLELQEIWCSEGYTHNVAWIASEQISHTTDSPPQSGH